MTEWDILCVGCFQEKNGATVCPHCGFDEAAPRSPLVLPYRTVIGGQYVVGKVLGKPGGFGITYLGFDTILNIKVAIKEYLPRELVGRAANGMSVVAHSEDDAKIFHSSLERFLQEARTLVRIDHPNVVRVRNYLEANETAYLVMSYYEGITLSEYLEQRGGKISEEESIGFLRPIMEGLREVHNKGFLHRDIKPGNIYLTKEGRPILLDFGAARSTVKDHSRGLSVVLSPGFAPPEQYHRSGEQGAWTDVYGCAATLYYLTTGELPPEVTERMTKDGPDPIQQKLNALSPSVRDAIVQGMALSPRDRPANIDGFIALLTGQPIGFTEVQTQVRASDTSVLNPSAASGYIQTRAVSPEHAPQNPYYEQATHERTERKWEWFSWLIFVAGVILALVAGGIYFLRTNKPTQLVVSAKGKADFQTIADAVKVATDGMKVFVEPGVYRESFVIENGVELIGRKEKGEVVIENSETHPLEIKSLSAVVRGFTIRVPKKVNKGLYALVVSIGTPRIEDCLISSKDSTSIWVHGKDVAPTFKNIKVSEGVADGIVFDQNAGGILEDSQVFNNGGWGVVVRGEAHPTIQRTKIHQSKQGGMLVEASAPILKEVESFENTATGIYLKNANPSIENSSFHDNGENGFFISQQSKGTMKEIQVFKNGFAGIAIRDGSEPVINNSKVFDGKDLGIWIYEGGKGTIENTEVYRNQKHGIQVGVRADPLLSRVRVYGGNQNGILFHESAKGKVENSEIFGNTMSNVVITGGANPTITQTKMYDSKESGLSVTNGGRGTIEMCQIYRNVFQNVHIANAARPTIRTTDIYDGQSGGVWVTAGGGGLIENSNIYNNNKFGVGIESQGEPTIKQCKIYGGRSHGIWIASGGRGTIQDNQIYGNAEYGVYINPNTAPSLVNNTINSNAQGDVLDLGF
jgi:parallel beta-helix repeat protein